MLASWRAARATVRARPAGLARRTGGAGLLAVALAMLGLLGLGALAPRDGSE